MYWPSNPRNAITHTPRNTGPEGEDEITREKEFREGYKLPDRVKAIKLEAGAGGNDYVVQGSRGGEEGMQKAVNMDAVKRAKAKKAREERKAKMNAEEKQKHDAEQAALKKERQLRARAELRKQALANLGTENENDDDDDDEDEDDN